jgi:hypothetical protein
MWRRAVRDYLGDGRAVVRCVVIAAVVGTLLSALNQGDTLTGSGMDAVLGAKLVGNYLIPFLVCSLGYVSSLAASGRERGSGRA